MRVVLTSLMAFFISGMAGGLLVQILAERTNATEEFILAFMASALYTIVATVAFFVTQLTANPRRAVDTVGRSLLIGMVAIAVGLAALSMGADGIHVPVAKEAWLLLALVGSGIITVVVHWLFVRWRLGRDAPVHFGRGPEASA